MCQEKSIRIQTYTKDPPPITETKQKKQNIWKVTQTLSFYYSRQLFLCSSVSFKRSNI